MDVELISRAAAIDAIVSATSLPDVDSIKSIYNIGNGEEWVDGVYDAINAVEEVHNIDAIPVTWLEDIAGRYEYSGCTDSADVVMAIIEDWKKEQEAR